MADIGMAADGRPACVRPWRSHRRSPHHRRRDRGCPGPVADAAKAPGPDAEPGGTPQSSARARTSTRSEPQPRHDLAVIRDEPDAYREPIPRDIVACHVVAEH